MLKQEFSQINAHAVQQLCKDSVEEEAVLVQVLNLDIDKKGKLFCFLSDGHHTVKAFLKDKTSADIQAKQFSLILIKQHVIADSGRKFGVIQFELVCDYSKKIGSPTPIDFNHPTESTQVQPFQIQLACITNRYVNMMHGLQKKEKLQSIPIADMEQEKIEKQKQVPKRTKIKDFEMISGLYIGLKNWHLLCRITKLDYQQFTKKNSDKLMKVLNIELIDRSKVKIYGVFFNQAAEKFKNRLLLNSVYEVSGGAISNDTYNKNKNDKTSPYRLTFGLNSKFQQTSDVNIARREVSAVTLANLIINPIFNEELDIIGILVEIQQPKEFTKDGKPLKMRKWVIADPIQMIRIHAVVWNDRFPPNPILVGKTIILGGFTLVNYNGTLTLNSNFRSVVQLATHLYQALEQKAIEQYKSWPIISQSKSKEGVAVMRNAKQLKDAAQLLSADDVLHSDIIVHISRFFTKKWYFEACPHCNKYAEKGVNCQCGKFLQQTTPHFIMGVELSDDNGSFYSTVYDQQAKTIFCDDMIIYKLVKLDQTQLKRTVDGYLHYKFKFRVYTKKDQEGKIRHNISKLERQGQQKISKINNLRAT